MPLMAGGRRSASNQDDSSDEEMKQVEERPGDEEEEEEEEEEFVVEKILDHKYEDGVLKYKVKWKDYEKKSDQTWEPEDTLEEVVALEEYLQKIGGRPSQTPGKRSRKSTGGASTPAPKKSRVKQEGKEDDWDPPAGSWEDDVRMIETLDRNGGDHICYIQWANGRRSQHPLHVVYQRCPQKMLKFYESHLVFRDSAGTISAVA
ncbi:uncharacterized protein DFL_004724 [Arthrobotrys flagrans]|uniref:Chromo domain-containing protein n=1 Tax=Arthrobotrys flagrans TaxID=97331 RepID=A0A437A616_ARTFL|nr:hypothetical protein DFL_004724 [Arthrobotrys flagrans]